jgi:8-oxo-dGTP pyrophosphatase MutT (NUDIX family)
MKQNEVTAGGIVCQNRHLLLVWKEGGENDGWTIPKGHIEPGESYEQTAVRECREETGICVDVVQYLGKVVRYSIHPGYEGVRKEIHVYLLRQLEDTELSTKVDELSGWVDIDQLNMRYEEEAEFIAEHRGKILGELSDNREDDRTQ